MTNDPAVETAQQKQKEETQPLANKQDQAQAAAAPTHHCKVVLAGTVANKLMEEVRRDVAKLEKKPLLVGFLANTDPAAKMYADWTAKTCRDNGFDFDLRTLDKEELEDAILAANVDDNVNGMIIYFPVFNTRHDSYLQQLPLPTKDVEGLSHRYLFNMYQNTRFLDPPTNTQKSLLPCTPLAIIKILEYIGVYNSILPYGNRLFGRTITVVNRSEIVGRPLAALLANDGADVWSVDVTGVQRFTRGAGIKNRHHLVEDREEKLEDVVPKSDVVITGVPSKNYKFPTELLKDGAICINFSSEKNFGPEVKEKASIYVPAIGKVTITILLRNIIRLVENQRAVKAAEANANKTA
ncbi:NAD(P)-binding protein [Ascodesmis nigricans]|uniref:Methylenetetrahydrofolate dehydrogenase [NAD(+)] n=1 Tax=Ascodesmis nigricans TaxID=341454 RepID=A0A4S2MR90_9PEZI|nr:NAD(P)-binding protein [Ascodesmis nigricans]